MNRLYAVESTPTLTGAMADHRLRAAAAEIESVARAARGGGRRRVGRAARRAHPRSPAGSPRSRRTPGAQGPSVVVAGEFQTDGVHAAARPSTTRSATAARRCSTARTSKPRPRRGDLDCRSRAGHRRGPGRAARDHGRQPGVHRAGGPAVRRAPGQGAARRLPLGPRRRDLAALPLARPRGPRARELGRRARSFDGTVTLMQPLIEPLYEGGSAHEFLAAFSTHPAAAGDGDRQGLLDQDLQRRNRRMDVQASARRVVRERRSVLALRAARRIHGRHRGERRRSGHRAHRGRGSRRAGSRDDGAAGRGRSTHPRRRRPRPHQPRRRRSPHWTGMRAIIFAYSTTRGSRMTETSIPGRPTWRTPRRASRG